MMSRLNKRVAMDIADSCDLPDGAYWAMIEDLSGAEPSDFIDDGEFRSFTKEEKKAYKATQREYHKSRIAARIKTLTERGYTIQRFSDEHYLVAGICDWWPMADKWKMRGGNFTQKLFDHMFRELVARDKAKKAPKHALFPLSSKAIADGLEDAIFDHFGIERINKTGAKS